MIDREYLAIEIHTELRAEPEATVAWVETPAGKLQVQTLGHNKHTAVVALRNAAEDIYLAARNKVWALLDENLDQLRAKVAARGNE